MESNLGLFITYLVSLLLMIVLPIGLGIIMIRRFKVSWWVVVAGAAAYLIAQMMYYPVLQKVSGLFNDGVLPMPATQWLPLVNALIMGFLTALFEESARYFGFLAVKRKIKKVKAGVGFGVGFGGFANMAFALWPMWPIFGGILYEFIKIVFYNPGAQLAKGVSSEEVQYFLSSYAQFWTIPWHFGLIFGVKLLIDLSLQILLSVLVWKSVRYKKFGWLALAFLYHILYTGIYFFLSYNGWSYWAVNGILAIFLLVNLYLVYFFWKEESGQAKESLSESSFAEQEEEGSDEEEEDEEDDEDFDDEEEYDPDEEDEEEED